jgi:hypothetical protein
VLRPASIRLAMAISPSRRQKFDRAHLAQIHAHRVVGAVELLGLGLATATSRLVEVSTTSVDASARLFLGFSSSMTLMPISDSIDITSSICSELT